MTIPRRLSPPLVPEATFRALCRARELIHDGYGEPLTVREMARQAGFSPYHFLREFQVAFGMTPRQYLTHVRMARAKELLARSGASVTATCFDVGFSSVGSFSSLFSKRTGRSPIQYHREIAPLVQVPAGLVRVYIPFCFFEHLGPATT
ncbi:helix-turn-helix domain-containing protein [Pendulispora albinea]|uniref:AraC family transcriptional regulator n=1 Tax=Pendulispora albinea TaxID=2741071 RepID=A0ABZ2M4B0_9BACT